MRTLSRLVNFFTATGRNENLLRLAMEHASANCPQQAIAIYDSLVDSQSADVVTRSRALFNRALSHSLLKNDIKAMIDLQAVVSMPGAPDNVVTAARTQLVRVRNRQERRQVRTQQQPMRKAG
jgi:hypothetical protein